MQTDQGLHCFYAIYYCSQIAAQIRCKVRKWSPKADLDQLMLLCSLISFWYEFFGQQGTQQDLFKQWVKIYQTVQMWIMTCVITWHMSEGTISHVTARLLIAQDRAFLQFKSIDIFLINVSMKTYVVELIIRNRSLLMNINNTVNSRDLEVQRTLWNTSTYQICRTE